jgi:hypothetical protein
MVVKEFYRVREDGVSLYKTYSSEGYLIQKVGTDEIYDEAIDPIGTNRVYEETNMPIENEDL